MGGRTGCWPWWCWWPAAWSRRGWPELGPAGQNTLYELPGTCLFTLLLRQKIIINKCVSGDHYYINLLLAHGDVGKATSLVLLGTIYMNLSPTCGQSRRRTRRRWRSSWWAGRWWWCRKRAPEKTEGQPDKNCFKIWSQDCKYVKSKKWLPDTHLFCLFSFKKVKNIFIKIKKYAIVFITNLKTAVFSSRGGYVTILRGGRWHKYGQLVLCNSATKNMFIAVICGPSLIPCTRQNKPSYNSNIFWQCQCQFAIKYI